MYMEVYMTSFVGKFVTISSEIVGSDLGCQIKCSSLDGHISHSYLYILNTFKNSSLLSKSSTLSYRNDNHSTPYKEESHSSTQAPVDSAYVSSPSGTAKNGNASPAINSNNAANFEMDSAALSAAFGSEQILKHSTAKKSIIGRTNKNIVKKK